MPSAPERARRPEPQTKPNSSQRLIQHNYTPLALSPSPHPVQLHSSYLASPSLANHQGCSSPASSHSSITHLLPLIITCISHTAQPILSLLFPASYPSLCHHSISAAPPPSRSPSKTMPPSQNITVNSCHVQSFFAPCLALSIRFSILLLSSFLNLLSGLLLAWPILSQLLVICSSPWPPSPISCLPVQVALSCAVHDRISD